MKKYLKLFKAMLLTAVLGVACFSLTACNEKTQEEEETKQTVADPQHTIVFYNTMGTTLQTTLKLAIAQFEEKVPGWSVQSSQVGGYDEVKSKVIGDFSANSQPDLAYCYADHVASYLSTGKVLNIGEFINDESTLKANVLNKETGVFESKTYEERVGYTEDEIADFIPGYYAEGYASNYASYSSYGFAADDMLTLPFQKSTEVLFYNADALKELGVDVPETWDELWAICSLAKEKWPTSTPLGYDSESNWFITTCKQNGWAYTSASAPHYQFNTPEAAAWLDELAGYYSEGLFTTQEIYGSYSSNLFVKGPADGGTIFSIGSSAGASYQATENFKWGVAPIPGSVVGTKVSKAAISQGPSLVMFETSASNSKEKQLMTWEFVKILLDPVFQCSFAGTTGYMPARLSSYEQPDYVELLANKTNIVGATVSVAKEMTSIYYTSPAFDGSSTAREQVGVALRYAVTGEKSGAVALRDAARKCGA